MSKSKIFLFSCLAFLFGVFLASIIEIPKLFWLGGLALGLILFCFVGRRNRALIAWLIFFVFFIVGIYVFQRQAPENLTNGLSRYNERGVAVIRGAVIEDPQVEAQKIKIVLLGRIKNAEGRILVVLPRYPDDYHYGDELEIFGRLQTPASSQSSGNFNYQNFLAKDDIYSIIYFPKLKKIGGQKGNFIYANLYNWRHQFEKKIGLLLPEPAAAFLNGLILGQKKTIPDDLTENLKKTGTTHLVVLSGYNITIIAAILMGLFSSLGLSRWLIFWLATTGIVFFVIMTGAAPSVVRAAVMGILVLLARREGRLYNPANALIFAGALMVFFNPKILRFDLGFQLSFLATAGLLYLTPFLEKKLERLPAFLGLKDILVSTLAAQIAVLPLLLVSFKNFSLISPLANILILPLIPLTMFLGAGAVMSSFLWFSLAQALAWLVWLFLNYEMKIIEFLAKIPLASFQIFAVWPWLAVYGFLLGWFILKYRRETKSPRTDSGAEIS